MDMNLYDVIKGRDFRGMKVKYIRRIALHILVGLCFLARHNIIHCDMKPENVLLKKKDDQKGYIIKIIDFGSA
jgi:dual specificity tyrosine-phosphorylation-regulated kinase 2/3/4